MALLLLLKVFIPFLIVSIYFMAANTGDLAQLSTHVALITNMMAMVNDKIELF